MLLLVVVEGGRGDVMTGPMVGGRVVEGAKLLSPPPSLGKVVVESKGSIILYRKYHIIYILSG